MTVRPIDGNELVRSLKNRRLHILMENENDGAAVFDDIVDWIKYTPTLTPPNEWVSVEERLPDELTMVLIYSGGIHDVAGWIEDEDGKICWTHNVKPQFWMPLPAPPDRRPPEGEEDT